MTYPPWLTGDLAMGRTSSDLCPLRIRGVFAGAGENTAGDGGASCYASALEAVNSYDFAAVPWGNIYFMDYGSGESSCSSVSSLVTPAYLEINFDTLVSYCDFDGPRTPYSFGIQKLQIILPPTWNIQAFTSSSFSNPPGRCCANDTDWATGLPIDPDYPDMKFYDDEADGGGSRLIVLPVPSWGPNATYWLNPCNHCAPET